MAMLSILKYHAFGIGYDLFPPKFEIKFTPTAISRLF